MKQIKVIKVDGVTVVQLWVNGRLYTEVDLYSQYTKKQAISDLLSLPIN